MGSFGFAIIQTLVTDIVPAKKVKEAMNEINAATRLRYMSLSRWGRFMNNDVTVELPRQRKPKRKR